MSYKRFLRIFSVACLLGLVTSALQFTPITASGPSITLSQSSGPRGTTITITGQNWAPYDYVFLWENSVKFGAEIADASGHFTHYNQQMPPPYDTRLFASCAVTAIVAGGAYSASQTFTVTDSGGEEPPPTTTIGFASMYLSPASGPPGTSITITGAGFGPSGTPVSISSDWGGSTTTNTTNSSGNFTAVLVLPTVGLTSPTYGITATAGSNSVTKYFMVTPTSTFTLSANNGFVGDSVLVTGTGFTPGTTVSFFMDSNPAALASLTPTAEGALAGSITIPAANRGNHTISASVSGVPTQQFTVNSKIIVSPVTGGVGDIVSVAGSGFDAGPANIVTISFDSLNLTTSPSTVNSDANGSFSCVLTIPSVTQGSHTLKATDNGGSATASLSIVPKMTLTPSGGFVGDRVVINGNGFSGNQTVTLTIDGNAIPGSPPLTSGQNGSINISFDIPALAGGTHTIRASDQDGHFCEATLTISPKITITPASGTVGSLTTITGNGFVPGAVTITWDGSALASPVSTIATNTGIINVTFAAPVSAKIPSPGHVITASDTAGNQSSGNFIILPKIMLSSSAGAYGDTITWTLTGFTPNAVISTSLISGDTAHAIETNPTTVQTDANGNATATFVLPEVYNGNWTVQASDGVETSAKATLAVGQKLTLDTDTGAAGDTVTAKGTGFSANTVVTLTYKGIVLGTIPSGISSDTNGSFTCQFIVPPTTSGTLIVAASDGFNVSTLNFTAIAKATINKVTTELNQGFVDMEMTISGTGFEPNALVTLSSESETITQVSTDANGCFTASFKFPIALSGLHTITACDGTTTKDFAFFMDSVAPTAPQLVLPSDKLKPKQPVPFNWQGVIDPSGVIYTLQISHDPNFGILVLEKTGLTAESYTMAATEQLKRSGSKTPYYWRVRATDQAGNVGPWSVAYTFTIGLILPSWMIYVWIGLGILAAFFFGLWIGHRGVYARYLYQ